jgi:hypothetical protein
MALLIFGKQARMRHNRLAEERGRALQWGRAWTENPACIVPIGVVDSINRIRNLGYSSGGRPEYG